MLACTTSFKGFQVWKQGERTAGISTAVEEEEDEDEETEEEEEEETAKEFGR